MSFKTEFKSYLQSGITALSSAYTFEVTNDNTRRFKDKTYNPAKTIGIVINYGNADRQRYGSFVFYNQSIQIISCVRLNDKETISNLLTNYFEELAENDTMVSMNSYKVAIQINPFTCDGITRNINGEPCVLIQALGTVSFTDAAIDSLVPDDIYFKVNGTFTILKGVISEVFDHSANEDAQVSMNYRYAIKSITNEAYSVQVSFLVSRYDSLHAMINALLKNSNSSYSLRQDVQFVHKNTTTATTTVTTSFSTILKLNATFQLGNFTVMTLTISR